MSPLSNTFARQFAFLSRGFYTTYEKILARLLTKRKFKILFSTKDDWQPAIEIGFKNSQHQISFGELTPENIANHTLVMPLTIADLLLANQFRHLLTNNPVPIPSTECLLLCDDKARFYRTMIANNYGDFMPKIDGKLEYPLILKKKTDMWGENTHILRNESEEQSLLKSIKIEDYVRQEFIPGKDEYATHILFSNGKIIKSLTLKHSHQNDETIRGKQETLFSTVTYCPYLDLFAKILISVGFEGICCIDYKIKDGRPLIFEINPRFGGSLSRFFFSFLRHLDVGQPATKVTPGIGDQQQM